MSVILHFFLFFSYIHIPHPLPFPLLLLRIGKTWNACVFEIERPAGEECNRIRGAQRRGFFAL